MIPRTATLQPIRTPRRLGRSVLLVLVLAGVARLPTLTAAVTLPALISDHMVLQRSDKTALWGTDSPGERIRITLGNVTAETTAAADGKWRVELNLAQAASGPFDVVIAGTNEITIRDVIVGEVWVASGQSNMEFNLSRAIGGSAEISTSGNPQLRQFRVANNAANTPQSDCRGSWAVADPATSGNFSAVGYYFAKKLQHSLQTPVGLITSCWGGTPVEAWTSRAALESEPVLKTACARIDTEVAQHAQLKSAYVRDFQAWAKRYGRIDREADPTPFVSTDVLEDAWKPVNLPGKLRDAGLPDAGAVWVRKIITLHGDAVGAPQLLDLAGLNGYETIYFNGKKVGGITPQTHEGPGSSRRYYARNSVDGKNVLAVRIAQPVSDAGIEGDPEKFVFGVVPTAGEWLAKVECALPPLPDEARQARPVPPKAALLPHLRPALLYNGMVHPLLPCTMAGIIWYQGEQNVSRAHQYGTAFPLLIRDWRRAWGRESPFYFCQLPAFGRKAVAPGDGAWAEMREAQAKALELPRTEAAILLDLGEAEDIHPRSKKEVGERLGAIALAQTYGKVEPSTGPRFEAMKIEGRTIRLAFRGAAGGLVAGPVPSTYILSSLKNSAAPVSRGSPPSELEGFAICGADHLWVWADAKIEGSAVVVSSTSVVNPVAVRYAWANNPTANLCDKAGLPAAPFRTDTFPGITDNVGL